MVADDRFDPGDPMKHQGWVGEIVNLFLGRGIEREDLMQEGNIGLLTACRKFDPSRGVQFSTYATYWIRNSLQQAFADKSRYIRIPKYLLDAIAAGQTPEDESLSRKRRDGLLAARFAMNAAPCFGGEEGGLHHVPTPDPDEPAVENEVLAAAFKRLTDRERTVVNLRFGLDDGRPQTLQEVGETLGVCRERVRQIEMAAITKLRAQLEGS